MFRFLGRYLRGIQGKPRSAVAAAFRMSQRTRHDEFRMGTLWQPQLDLVAGKQLKTQMKLIPLRDTAFVQTA